MVVTIRLRDRLRNARSKGAAHPPKAWFWEQTEIPDLNPTYHNMEVVGLVLAVVPMVSLAAEQWTKTYARGKIVLSQKTKDAAAVKDYRLIHWDLAILDVSLRQFVEALPTLADAEKTKLLATELELSASAWTTARIESALEKRLGSVNSREAFVDCLRAICEVLETMISDRTLGLVKSDLMVSFVRTDLRQHLFLHHSLFLFPFP